MQILVVGSKTHVCNAKECIIAVQCHFRVNQGRWFRVFDFLLVINSNLCHISHRFRDTAAYWLKIANLYPPDPHSMPSLGVTPFEFWDEPDISKY